MFEDAGKLLAVALLLLIGQVQPRQQGNVFDFFNCQTHGDDYNGSPCQGVEADVLLQVGTPVIFFMETFEQIPLVRHSQFGQFLTKPGG